MQNIRADPLQRISVKTSELILIVRNTDSLTAEASSITLKQVASEQDMPLSLTKFRIVLECYMRQLLYHVR